VKVPLARALSKLGIMSRTQAIEHILAGDVRVAGRVVRDPGYGIVPEIARITIKDTHVEQQPPVTILLHKPRGVVTTRSDPQGRTTVYDVVYREDGGLPGRPYVAPVGRLDLASSGLLVLTSDTRLSDWLLDPAHAIPRTYIVSVRGKLSDETISQLEHGIRDRGELLRPSRIALLKRSGRETHLRVELIGGKNRELRRLFAACHHEVTRLTRVAFGGLELGRLAPGEWRIVRPEELIRLFPGAPVRSQIPSGLAHSRAAETQRRREKVRAL
jgi:23S rRNA pseudouridine2605 synthase